MLIIRTAPAKDLKSRSLLLSPVVLIALQQQLSKLGSYFSISTIFFTIYAYVLDKSTIDKKIFMILSNNIKSTNSNTNI